MDLGGLHHLTAVTTTAAENVAFYTEVLGLRLVKKTVNQDDVSAYHLFYADALASPGSDLTFFDWPAAPERRGTNSIARTALRVSDEGTFDYWTKRLTEHGVKHSGAKLRDGRLSIHSRIRKVSAFRLSMTAVPATPIPGTRARCRPRTRSAASARSC
jgi:glyoxalase family protein